MYVAKLVCQASLPSFLTWVSLEIFCLEKCQMDISSASLWLSLVSRRDNSSYWCMNFDCLNDGSSWATCKCNISCPTSCIEISSWKRPISNSMYVIFLLQDSVKHRHGLLEIQKQVIRIATINLWSTCPERSIDHMLK